MKIENLVATTGEYVNKQWDKKKQYTTIWRTFTKDDWSRSIKIEVIPLWRDWRANIYEQKEKKDNSMPF